MVARKLLVRHNDSEFDIDYDTDDGLEVLKFQLFSLTSIPPDEQRIVGHDDDRTVADDSDLVSVSDRLRLISIADKIEENGALEGQSAKFDKSDEELALMLQIVGHDDDRTVADDSDLVSVSDRLRLISIADKIEENGALEGQSAKFDKSDEELALMLQAEEEALMIQQFAAADNDSQIEGRIRPYVDQVLMYEDEQRQESARKTVPREILEEKMLVALAKEGKFKPTKDEQDYAFLLQLLFWFKRSFRWVHAPLCDGCGSETLSNGMGVALPSETQFGASRVELYRCKVCSIITRFPRYNDPLKLLETRKGRCGEWANCFTLYCRAFGYESRLIIDFTDHVWTECFSPYLGRWMHLDPCEGIYDNPLLYESGWGKKLNYIFAVANDGVYDVTKRYTRKWHEVLSRRHITTEADLSTILSNIRRECRKHFTSKLLAAVEERDRNEADTLQSDLYSKENASISLPGRQSGDREWRISRSEFGSDGNHSLSSSSCPIRRCIDEHVTRIYDAFLPVISCFAERHCSKSQGIELLQFFRQILVNIKNSPYKTRTTSISSGSGAAYNLFHEMWPSFQQLFNALSLKIELSTEGRFNICLADEPVKTSIALPVMFHALDDVINNYTRSKNASEDSLSWPSLKLNRICSGLVLASGEELPFGIVTSAFDGTRMSKWEEPNGAKGCWIIYKVPDNQKHELAAYEIMSANDAPERDPSDWVLEGSNDGGSTWCLLDEQASQMFENRFERKTFEIKPRALHLPANTFRFRFLSVRDSKATSRFQVGSIDLYAKG